MFKLELNLDAYGEAELFINNYSTTRGRRLANLLGLSGKGSATLASAISNYAWNTFTAQRCRVQGRIETAKQYEDIAERIYQEDIKPICVCW